jgi:hypothetical protein
MEWMMESKAVVYAVLAVAIGYLLVSAVPNRLTALRGDSIRSIPEEIQSPEVEGIVTDKESLKSYGEETSASKDETTGGLEPELVSNRGGAWVNVLGVWFVNLSIALGIYFAVKHRLS